MNLVKKSNWLCLKIPKSKIITLLVIKIRSFFLLIVVGIAVLVPKTYYPIQGMH